MNFIIFRRTSPMGWPRPARIIVAVLLGSIVAALAAPWLLRGWVHWRERGHIFTHQTAPANAVALVLGAGLWRDGTPSPVLYDRVATAVELYRTGAVKKLLLSGDNRFEYYNEPEAMRRLAIGLGVPAEDIVLDYAGRRTYDSCYRARDIFQVSHLTVVTQRFHLDRALYLCNALGLEAVGVVADQQKYRPASTGIWELREVAATVKAWLDINLLQPQPVLGEKIPIQLTAQIQ
jgi:SanA protein